MPTRALYFLLHLGAAVICLFGLFALSRAALASARVPSLRWLRHSALSAKPVDDSGTRWQAVDQRFRDHVVVRFNVTNPDEEAALAAAAERLFLDVWAFTPDYVDVRLDKKHVSTLLSMLPSSPPPLPLITDLAAAVWTTFPLNAHAHAHAPPKGLEAEDIFFRNYQPLSAIAIWLRYLEAMFPSRVQLTSIGSSYEGRDIMALRLAADINEPASDDKPRKTVLLTGGIHGREWISTSTVNYLIWSFATAYGKDRVITKFLQQFDIVFLPVLNPDGYQYTWDTDRLWRKSRQPTPTRFCRGQDLDHAFGYAWDAADRATDPCSERYGGDAPFQAVEAAALAAWAVNRTRERHVRFVGLLDLHAYSQQVLFPFAHTCGADPPNLESLQELAVGLAKAIRVASGERYSVASACESAMARSSDDARPRIEARGGSLMDWVFHELGARFNYQIKLRDTGSYGFLLPPEQIVPTGEEMLAVMRYFGDYLLGNNGIERLPLIESPQGEDEQWRDLKRRKRR
ncbi:hypothetical protein P8C59_006630 [Phyllachora maydis]|uniref:Inactive metallocarboxypeptidase ECM14 n=1 Tax=Phyllachora maydis TaxID=1825666 RepID=A0AAD9I7Y7_9PEZI|nr:hypothetical protein P8C59_006630 [Phyllachora maydis]